MDLPRLLNPHPLTPKSKPNKPSNVKIKAYKSENPLNGNLQIKYF